MLGKKDLNLLETLESQFDNLIHLDKEILVDIIKAQKNENDKFKNIKRNSIGEEIIQDDQAIEDEEEYL